MLRSKRTSVRMRCALITAAGAIVGWSSSVRAVAITWDNGGNNFQWSTPTNWSTNTEPTVADDVTFPVVVPDDVNAILLSSGEQARSVTFNNNYDLVSGNLTLGTGANITTASGTSCFIDSALLGSNGLMKLGTGSLTLLGANTFTGGVNVNAGSLVIDTDGRLGNGANGVGLSSSTLVTNGSFSSTRTFTIGAGGANINANSGTSLTLASGLATTANTLTANGAGTLIVNSASARTGATNITNGVVRVNNATALGSGSINLNTSGVLEVGSVNVAQTMSFGSTGTIRGTGNSTYSGTITVVASATVELSAGTSASDVLTIGTATLAYRGGTGANTFVSGNGTISMPFQTDYTGGWQLNSGTVRIGHANGLGSASPAVIINAAALEINGVTLSRSVTLNNGATLRGLGSASHTGAAVVTAGASITLASGASSTDLLSMGSSTNHLTSGAGATIHIGGSGVVHLPFSNSGYTGDWQVDSGTLRISHNLATAGGTSAIPVASGAIVEINNLNWGRNLTLNNGSTLRGVGNAFYGEVATVAGGASVTFATGPSPTDQLSNSVVGSSIAGGAGATIHVAGPGRVTLFQPSTYSGNWAVDGGTLRVSVANNTGVGTSPIAVNNTGVLEVVGGTNFARNITLNNGSTLYASMSTPIGANVSLTAGTETIDVINAATLTISGIISSAATGTLKKAGLGTLLTTFTNSFGGPVNIDSGTLRQTAGSNAVGAFSRLTIGSTAASTGTYELVNGSLTADEERIGEPGNGVFIQSGGTHTVSGGLNPLWHASAIGATSSYTLSGGILNVVNNTVGANGEAVGFNGTATFTQTGGTHSVTGTNGNLVIGYAPTGIGTYTISGGVLRSNSLYLGRDGGATGTLNINGGSVDVVAEFLELGLNVGATGTVNVNAGSISAQGIYVGGTSSQPGGTGVLNVSGHDAISSGEVRVWDTTGSAINLSSTGRIFASSLNSSGNPSRINFTGGTLVITGPGGFTVSPTGALGANPTIVSSATMFVDYATTVGSGSTLNVSGIYLTQAFIGGAGALAVLGSGDVDVFPNGGPGGVSHLGSLSVAPTGSLDLADNDLVVNNGSFTQLQALVLAGFGTDGPGIISSTSNGTQILALFDNALVGAGDWLGTTISANAIVGKYTYFGDVNIDGQVTGDDYTVIDANLDTTPAVGLGWLSGDANLDGIVTGDDYTVIDANLGLGQGNPLSSSALAVPEPGGYLVICAISLARVLSSRRRRREIPSVD